MYQIISNILSGIPQQPYQNGIGQYQGVVLHATDSWEDTAEGEHDYEQGTWKSAFVHFFVDDQSIVQVAPTEYKAWGAGPQANARFVHIELCQSRDTNKFIAAYERWVWLAAYLLFKRDLGVTEAKSDGSGTLWAHKDVTQYLGGTTHEDPIEYLNYHGKTWANVVNDVTYLYNCMTNPSEPDKPKEIPTVDGFCKVISNGITYEGVIITGHSYAPVRDVAEGLGHTVDWNGDTNTVVIK